MTHACISCILSWMEQALLYYNRSPYLHHMLLRIRPSRPFGSCCIVQSKNLPIEKLKVICIDRSLNYPSAKDEPWFPFPRPPSIRCFHAVEWCRDSLPTYLMDIGVFLHYFLQTPGKQQGMTVPVKPAPWWWEKKTWKKGAKRRKRVSSTRRCQWESLS